jgi:hypothetical protein
MIPPCKSAANSKNRSVPLASLDSVHHMSNANAVAYGRGEVNLVGYYYCESCDGWVPTFTETTP